MSNVSLGSGIIATLVTLAVIEAPVQSLPVHTQETEPPALTSICTSIPSLYENYKKTTLGREGTDKELREHLETQRERVSKLKDPFTPIARMTEAERAAAGERVLWEDATVMVLVDRFSGTPKPLVVPKKEMMFPIDASQDFIKRLAMVAAATSDALMWAVGGECDPSSSSKIYVNPPTVIGVRQLHVHVKPADPLRDINAGEFYTGVSKYLRDRLHAPAPDATEASGVTRLGGDLLIVTDEEPGAYYRFDLAGIKVKDEPIPIEPSRLTRVAFPSASFALDLEAIDVLADGRVVVLSERLRALIAEDGKVIQYDDPLSEIGERGLEGLAVRGEAGRSLVAVLWEGGYLLKKDLPAQLHKHVGNRSFQPVIVVQALEAGALNKKQRMRDTPTHDIIMLDVPRPDGDEPQAQRFRAPDFVWHRWERDGQQEWGFIVLLNSMSADPVRFEHLWLQRFNYEGRPIGDPLDLDTLAPAELKGFNWEGLGWYEEGKSLVLIHDTPQKLPDGLPAGFVIGLPDDWKWRPLSAELRNFTHVLQRETEYYLDGPQQARPPDGTFRAGTKVMLLQESGSYSVVQTEDGITAYVSTASLQKIED